MSARAGDLHLDLSSALNKGKSAKSQDVAESWEDEDVDMDTPTASDAMSPTQPTSSNGMAPNPPPPTPISPAGQGYDWSAAGVLGGGRPQPRDGPGLVSQRGDSDRRPEKTTATASRMIAAGLGVRAPKKTEEQKQYDRAVKEQEIKRKNREKEDRERAQADDERAKAAVWDG
ncbi:uncharacterized protein AB675_2904 [Cyphellophora attinorum]|uniref:Uncharacterized protein n=1 Tax=Cyphellophora attinorum TaxID=1664694 RepID=A0A0N1H3V5_9EURO|nr:uncharacterized protein AB675_2904 [Phialophora attinorum]KPI36482.1 hypothetical protein AB675_2904 [Phialophora attinorum]